MTAPKPSPVAIRPSFWRSLFRKSARKNCYNGAMRRTLLALALLLSLPLAATTKVTPTPLDSFLSSVRKRTLPNGLTVISREAPGTGVVAVNVWVKAGYFHEPDAVAGMAHLFEHMLFKGSKNFPEMEQFAEEIAAAGGNINAGTIYDSTNYFFT